jgi:hypothetical protein
VYQGQWKGSSLHGSDPFFSENEGKFEMKVSHVVSFNGMTRYKMEICILNGKYIDNGVLDFYFYLDDNNFTSMRQN